MAEEAEAQMRMDISVFLLATPLIAGSGALASILILQDEAVAYPFGTFIVLSIVVVVLLLLYGSVAIAKHLTHWLGQTGINVISRVLGILLSALAVQYIVDGTLTLVKATFKI
jgi:multiple antibiotic resistance protein